MDSINKKTNQWLISQNISSHFIATTTSTNAWAKESFNPNLDLEVFVSDHQSLGRGRGNHTWTNTPDGGTLLSTWSFPLSSPPQPIFNIKVGLGLFKSCKTAWPQIPFSVKAPNDLYIDDKKMAGLLTEVVSQGSQHRVFVGLGMNVFNKPDIADQKTICIMDLDTFEDSQWYAFLQTWGAELKHLASSASQPILTDGERLRVLKALQPYSDNHVVDVENDGTLNLQDGGRIHWNEL
jgi:BirA family transcriptional regulator, biotin operon repressor / biotin---[acetyl-CoA-carboxylase] ligase